MGTEAIQPRLVRSTIIFIKTEIANQSAAIAEITTANDSQSQPALPSSKAGVQNEMPEIPMSPRTDRAASFTPPSSHHRTAPVQDCDA